MFWSVFFFFQAEDGIRYLIVTGVQTCAFFFSSRRRHTRSDRDWSSDVCSSDLRATDAFSSLCVFGIASLIFSHIVENVGMTVNLLPITGIPLPFFSYGGSFMLACSLAVGIALREIGRASCRERV